ncbi:MAG: flavodoxin [Bacillota bacterium]
MRIFVGYVSMSGNTEDMAAIIKEELLFAGCEVEMESLETIEVVELLTYDGIILGSYTWGNGDLPYEAEDFYEELNDWNLDGMFAACFGSGDHAYPKFCAAVDTLAHKLEERGGCLYPERLKMELSPETNEQMADCRQFARFFLSWINTKEPEHVY